MEWFKDIVLDLSVYSRTYLPLIALMLTALLVVYGGRPILTWSASLLKQFPILLRVPMGALLNMVALGSAFLFVPEWLAELLNLFNDMTLAPVLLIILLLAGVFVDRFK